MTLLVLGTCCLFILAAFASPKIWFVVTALAVGLVLLAWFSESFVANLIILVLRAQSQDADVLRWACPWTPNGGTCIFKLRGIGLGAIALPLALGIGLVVRRRRQASAIQVA